MVLVKLTAAGGANVWVNPVQVAVVQPASTGTGTTITLAFSPGSTAASNVISVTDAPASVAALLQAAARPNNGTVAPAAAVVAAPRT
jgi:hypothetical protein